MVDDKMFKKIKKTSDPKKRKFTTLETILLVIMSLLIGLLIGSLFMKTNTITKKTTISDEDLKEFIKNYEYILNNYYEKVDKRELINNAIKGMMESLDDPYSVYFDETESENFTIALDGSYQGIGVQIMKNEETGNILITAIFKDSPAFDAGLKVGDEIISIDDLKTKDYTASEFSQIIKESNKKNFELKVLRDGKTLTLTLERSLVTLNSVASELYEEDNRKIGYIYIGIFANNTYYQFKNLLDDLEKKMNLQ